MADLKQEVANVEVAQIKAKARNMALRDQLTNVLEADDSGTRMLQIQNEKLQKSKLAFVRILD